ncbi:MAG: prolyl oligopeptidase family serine peptidase [Bacteroidota bacterium]|nr:prolyl oligopeptidase family serine peptidase [Bacteroidota bacterium]
MIKNLLLVSLLALLALACKTDTDKKVWEYPETEKSDVVYTYFGEDVTEPYYWLENDTSKETEAWVTAQNKVTFSYLNSIPFRDDIRNRLEKNWDYPKQSAPYHKAGYYFYYRNDGLQNQSVLYIKDDLDSEGRVLLDPNALSEDGTVALAGTSASNDVKYLAYGISRSGSDWKEYFVKDIESGNDLSDHLQWIKFSGVAWYGDGFFYSRFPEPKEGDELSGMNKDNRIFYHKLGDNQSDDRLVYEDTENNAWSFSTDVTDDEAYLIISVSESTSGNALYFRDLNDENAEIEKIVTDFDHDFWALDHIDGKLIVMTNYEAPKYKLITIDPENPEKENWEDIIGEMDYVLRSVSPIGEKLIAKYMKDAHSVVKVFDLNGNYLCDVDIPVLGTVSGFGGDTDDTETFYTVTSFTTPSTVYHYDIDNNESSLYQSSEIDFDETKYETKQIFYESKDGTKVPMFIVHKKGIELDGNNPAILYGYGGFNISLTPSFSITRLIWLEQGGVYAMANLRGGGEYGQEWHKAGIKMKKQNVFDDFIAAAEYLIDEDYTNSDKLAIMGGSNGGLLVGAVTNQRPDLFQVAVPSVGVMDMLRYHLFTIGKYWASDYGTSQDCKEMFEYLRAYSPIHNIESGKEYPAVLVKTADHDDRVVPAHSFKYIATLQEHYKGENPVMIRIETKAGHGAGKPTQKIIDEYADVYAFIFDNMGITPVYENK